MEHPNHRWPLPSKFWKPSKNHWYQWLDPKKTFNGDGPTLSKPSKNHWTQWWPEKKTLTIPSLWKIDHRRGLLLPPHEWPWEILLPIVTNFFGRTLPPSQIAPGCGRIFLSKFTKTKHNKRISLWIFVPPKPKCCLIKVKKSNLGAIGVKKHAV